MFTTPPSGVFGTVSSKKQLLVKCSDSRCTIVVIYLLRTMETALIIMQNGFRRVREIRCKKKKDMRAPAASFTELNQTVTLRRLSATLFCYYALCFFDLNNRKHRKV